MPAHWEHHPESTYVRRFCKILSWLGILFQDSCVSRCRGFFLFKLHSASPLEHCFVHLIKRSGKTRSCRFAKSQIMFTPSTGYIKIYKVVFCFMWQHARWKFGGKRRQFYVFYTAENLYPLKTGCTPALRPRFCGKGAKLTDWHRKTFP